MNREELAKRLAGECKREAEGVDPCSAEEFAKIIEKAIDYGYALAVAEGAGDSSGR